MKVFAARKTAIRAVTVDEVLAEQLGEMWFLEPHGVQVASLAHWTRAHNAHTYARAAQEFSEASAIAEAQAGGYWCVVVENLG
ncbi:MAG: hypothetical protein H0T73_11270 [Ardenticatenales bacterium]|nr:hypothetical protein [Ardenticatenales bacterium]